MSVATIHDAIARENRPHIPDPAKQQAYAEKHGDRSMHGWKELTDIQVASRARMLMRDDWTHEAVCTCVRDRVCALVLEKQALVEAAAAVIESCQERVTGVSGIALNMLVEALAKAEGRS